MLAGKILDGGSAFVIITLTPKSEVREGDAYGGQVLPRKDLFGVGNEIAIRKRSSRDSLRCVKSYLVYPGARISDTLEGVDDPLPVEDALAGHPMALVDIIAVGYVDSDYLIPKSFDDACGIIDQ